MANLRVDKITSTETFETTGSVQFDRVGDYLTTDLGSGLGDNFTIEFWIISNGVAPGSSSPGMFQLSDTSGGLKESTSTLAMYWSTTHGVLGAYHQGESNRVSADPNANNVWKHYAFVRNNGIIKIYRDGKKIYTATSTTDYSSYRYLVIGGYWSTSYLWLGHISNFRIVDGKALYTSNFKPPMRELEVVPGTVVLACQSKTDTILEKTGKTITKFGSTVANELTPGLLTPVPKDGGGSEIKGSVEFNGSTDYLKFPVNTDCTFGTNDFTIEFWLNPGENPTNYTIIFSLTTDTAAKRFEVAYHSNSIRVYTDTATWRDTGIEPLKGEWHHFAFVRNYSGNSLIMYVNGINKWEVTNTRNYDELVKIPRIGSYASGSYGYLQGFLSNFRIVRGAALYTDNFTPPTRELKKVPGTVLLCCQDPNNPLTEATGKTITGYGSLYQVDPSINLADYGTWVDGSTGAGSASESNGQITMQGNGASDRGIITKTVTVVPNITYEMSFNVTDAASNGKTGLDSNDGTNDVLDDPTATLDMVHFSGAALDGNTGTFKVRGVATTTECVMYFQEFGAAGTTNFIVDTISLRAVGGGNKGASNFTPQVGDGRKVTFEGVTKINSDAYFYFPTGDTESRDKGAGTRGISLGGTNPSRTNIISFINISTTGNAQTFGELLDKLNQNGAVSSSTRGISGGGFGTSPTSNEIDTLNYITIASQGNAHDFGDLTLARRLLVGCSSQTRGIFAGGYDAPNKYNRMDYVTIATQGDAIDFGDLSAGTQTPSGRYSSAGYASPTRGVWHGGYGYPAYRNIIDYVTIASKGNSINFGDSSIANYYMGGCSNSIRGISAGAYNPSPAHLNLIEYTTIATTGNAQDFGDLPQKMMSTGACASQIRGVYLGGQIGGAYNNTMVYVTIMTMGNALDFGDLTTTMGFNAGCSNGHGGL